MVFDDDVHIRPYSLAHGGDAFFHELHEVRTHGPPALFVGQNGTGCAVKGHKVDFDGVVTLRDRVFGHIGIIFRRVFELMEPAPAVLQLAGVAAQLVALLAAQQAVERDVENFAADIPERKVDCADAGKDDGPPALAQKVVLCSLSQITSLSSGSMPRIRCDRLSTIPKAASH